MILALDCGSSKFPAIVKMLRDAGAEVQAENALHVTELPEGISGIVISGAPFLLSRSESPLQKTLTWLGDAEIPILGICFGHQLLGLLNGGSVYLGPEARSPQEITIDQEYPLFEGIANPSLFSQDHTEGLNPGPDFYVIAKSSSYETEAIKHKTKPHYGVQFHPEVSGEPGSIIFRNFLKLCQGF